MTLKFVLQVEILFALFLNANPGENTENLDQMNVVGKYFFETDQSLIY